MNAGPNWVVIPRRTRAGWVVPAIVTLLALLLITAGLLANANRPDDLARVRQMARHPTPQQTAVAPLNLVKPLTPEEAVKENQERPFDAAPDSAAGQFKLKTDQTSRDRALECLAQAVYYEAATEGADGQRAVAQVVLNRMRHPGFPSTVCGVVYQGSELPTGCQFTFTCDGSLARTPVAGLWTRARKIAAEALAGQVFAPVGHATHYHADYVLPYWADSLAKRVQIGHHIFYRLRGAFGTSAAFSQRYAGKEPDLPPPPSTVAVAVQAADQAQALLNSGLAGEKPPAVVADAAGIAAAADPKQVLLADNSNGALLIDHGSTPAPGAKPKKRQEECPGGDGRQIRPASPNDLHAGTAADGC
jgi:spore germination cell wall hydrolase CwlJ-like protein